MDDIDELLRALQEAINAGAELKKAQDEYDGCSWDWDGVHVIAKMDKARDCFRAALSACIADARVATAMAAAGVRPKGE